jgi:aminoglycoside/choline kinase family phosphotransferase
MTKALQQHSTDPLVQLFKQLTGSKPERIIKIKTAGSNRAYYRLTRKHKSYIGTMGDDPLESQAFLYLSQHFKQAGLHVPEIYGKTEDGVIYLQEDLGDKSLFDLVKETDMTKGVPDHIKHLYQKVLQHLVRFQVRGARGLDFTKCYPRQEFDRQSMQWDLNYFKYYYLKLTGVSFHEQRLETDFKLLMDYLLEAPAVYFMFRDFQTRNMMIRDHEPWFIDYQGGRKGPIQYDLASLLFQARAALPNEFRQEMLEFYMVEVGAVIDLDPEEFIPHYYGFVLLRLLQVLGAYGYRGYFEQKPHFIESTSYALKNLEWFINSIELPVNLPELSLCFRQMINKEEPKQAEGLTVEINSFSYKKSGIPKDTSGHGGGFVFDCRALPNPGRYPEYKTLTGKDKPVIEFLQKEKAVGKFLENVFLIIDQAIENYQKRGFDHLSVSFGCTGGQHRSVYCAETLFQHLKEKQLLKALLSHKMLD